MPSPESSTPSVEQPQFGFLEVTVLVLSIYVLGVMLAQALLPLRPEVHLLLDRIDAAVCLVFLAEFVVRFRRAPSKLRFMRWGWIDLLASIPVVDALRWGRLIRVVRIIRVLRGFRSARNLVHFLYLHRTRSLALTTLISTSILLTFSTIAILAFETGENSNIRTPSDALWWAVTTMTTVGYGDKYPTTTEGRIVAMILMIIGVGLFGVLTGLFARLFVEPDLRKEDEDIRVVLDEVRALRAEMQDLKARLAERS